MLYCWTRAMRTRGAWTMVAMYAFCVLWSPLAMAFGGNLDALPCITGEHHELMPLLAQGDPFIPAHEHLHHDGMVHHEGMVHHPADQPTPAQGSNPQHGQHMGACCALFCFTAIANQFDFALGETFLRSRIAPALED